MTRWEWRRLLRGAVRTGPYALRRLFERNRTLFHPDEARRVEKCGTAAWPRITERLRQDFRDEDGLPAREPNYEDPAQRAVRFLWLPKYVTT